MSWSSTNATACFASGGWSGTRDTSGSEATPALSASTNYSITCNGPGGSDSATVTVTVTSTAPPPPAPALTFSASPVSIAYNATSALSWNATNATSCVASGAWSGNKAVSGANVSTGALTSTRTYSLTCSGSGGSVSKSATVTVAPAPPKPTLSLTVNPVSVTSGGAATLTWSAANASGCTASGGWSGSRAVSGNESTGELSSGKTYTLSCTGSGGSINKSVSVSVSATGSENGLDFPGSDATTGTIRFEFTSPLAIYPATYIWKVYPRQQNGYYTTFFWGNNGNFWWDAGKPSSNYGAHPYPDTQPLGGTHKWEIAANGGDYVDDKNGNSTQLGYGRWYTQALRVWGDSSGKHHEFYWDLPDTSRVISVTESTDYGEKQPPSPVLVWGDAPWNPSKEIMNGILRSIQIYSATLTVNDILAESSNALSTSAGNANIWYLNSDPTPTDISDKSGKGHHPSWVGSERPALWVGQ